MGKPWAKYEVDFITHPKFRALNANAICLWIEGKNYCDSHMTDGLIPKHIVKQFRFNGRASVESLMASCGPKNEDHTYAPLWELHPVGFKMHDYLEYNDCRDVVLANMQRAEQRREGDRNRLQQWRDAKKAKRETATETDVKRSVKRVSSVSGNADETLSSDTATAVEVKKRKKEPAPDGAAPVANHPVKAFLTLYEHLFEASFGQKPLLVNGRDAKIAKTTIDRFGEPKAHDFLRLFFVSDDDFIRKSGYGLNIFAGQLNKLITEQTPRGANETPSSKLPAWARRKANA